MIRRILIAFGVLILVVVLVLGIGLWLLDIDALIERYKPDAVAAASEALGRPVKLGQVSATWFPDVGVVARDLEISAPEGTPAAQPLATADALRISFALWPALSSFGRQVEVDEITLVGPTIRVEKDANGRYSFSDILERSATSTSADDQSSAPPPDIDAYLQGARIDRIAIENGTIQYVEPSRAIEFKNVNLKLADVALGQPLHAELQAEVGSDTPNVTLTIDTTTLPTEVSKLVAVDISRLSLKVDALPLAPLALSVPGYLLDKASLSTDLEASMMAGALKLKGPMRLDGVASKTVEGRGEPFPLAVNANVEHNLATATTRLNDIGVELGPLALRLDGRVKASPLAGEVDVSTASPVALSTLKAATGVANLPPASLSVAGKVKLSPEAINIAPLDVGFGRSKISGRVDYAMTATGNIDVALKTSGLKVNGLLEDLELEPSAPKGSTVDVSLEYHAKRTAPGDGRVTIERFAYSGGKSALTASGQVGRLSPLQIRLTGQSKYLDLDALLPGAGEQQPSDNKEPPPKSETPPSDKPKNAGLVGLDARAALTIDTLKYAGVTMRAVDAVISMKDQQVSVDKLGVDVFGGHITADGTSIDLRDAAPKYNIATKVKGLDSAAALKVWSADLATAVNGRLSGDFNFSGQGAQWQGLSKSLTGALAVSVNEGQLSGVDLIRAAAGPLVQALAVQGGAQSRLHTTFDKLSARLSLTDGKLKTRAPIRIQTSEGQIDLTGSIGLDAALALSGNVELSPATIRTLTNGKVRIDQPVPVGLKLGCRLAKPCVEGVNADAAVKRLTSAAVDKVKAKVKTKVEKEVGQELDTLKRKAEKQLKGLFGK